MNLFSVEFFEDIEGNEFAFCWTAPRGEVLLSQQYERLEDLYDWAEERPDTRGLIEVPNEETAKSMIEHSREAQEDLSSYVFQHRGFIITTKSV